MPALLATAPGSWGVEPTNFGRHPPWGSVLDEVATAGYAGIELGPLGYLPTDPAELGPALAARELRLVAGYVMEPLQDAAESERILGLAGRTCELLRALGARHLVVIDGLAPERSAAAGRSDAAPRLGADGWRRLCRSVDVLCARATACDLVPVFHPHAGTYVEFEDEIDRLLSDSDVLLGLDTGHCAYAGIDPVAMYRRYCGRVAYLHCKDIDGARLDNALAGELSFEDAVARGVFCSLGEGTVDFRAFKAALDDAAYNGWAIVEQDRLPDGPRTALDDARTSLEHLVEVGISAGRVLSR